MVSAINHGSIARCVAVKTVWIGIIKSIVTAQHVTRSCATFKTVKQSYLNRLSLQGISILKSSYRFDDMEMGGCISGSRMHSYDKRFQFALLPKPMVVVALLIQKCLQQKAFCGAEWVVLIGWCFTITKTWWIFLFRAFCEKLFTPQPYEASGYFRGPSRQAGGCHLTLTFSRL